MKLIDENEATSFIAMFILNELQDNSGFIPLHDKSSPDDIKAQLQMSKKSFKKAIGTLYKDRQRNGYR